MNFWPVVYASALKFRFSVLTFAALVVAGVAVSVAVTSQERALREGSAKAAERFDVIVAPQGSATDALLTGVYLQPGSARLLSAETTAAVLGDKTAAFASPLAFGDSYRGHPIVGTVAALPEHLSDGTMAVGRVFASAFEAVAGANVDLEIGAVFSPTHGMDDRGEDGHDHSEELTLVGKMQPTGSPWDDAIVVPVEFVWHVHEEEHDEAEHTVVEPHHKSHDDHAHEQIDIGGPYTANNPGVPAIVLHVDTIADAYGLRDTYNTDASMAFFPAEVLLDLYRTLGDVSFLLFVMSVFSAVLVVLAIICGLFIMFRLLMTQFVTLRALGAPQRFIFGVSWGLSGSIFTAGAALGLVGGLLLANVVSAIIQQRTGIVLSPGIGLQEMTMVASIWGVGIAAGLLPALYITRKPLWQTIRAY